MFDSLLDSPVDPVLTSIKSKELLFTPIKSNGAFLDTDDTRAILSYYVSKENEANI